MMPSHLHRVSLLTLIKATAIEPDSFVESLENAFNRLARARARTRRTFDLISFDVTATGLPVRYPSSGYPAIRSLFRSFSSEENGEMRARARGEKGDNGEAAAVRTREPSIYQMFDATDFPPRAPRINSDGIARNPLDFGNRDDLCLGFRAVLQKWARRRESPIVSRRFSSGIPA